MNQFVKFERKFWNSNTAMLVGVIGQGQRFTHIDYIDSAYKKTKSKLKKIFGTQIPNFYVVDDVLVVVSIRQHRYKGRLFENLLITPVAECNGMFKQYELNWTDNKYYRLYERKKKLKKSSNG